METESLRPLMAIVVSLVGATLIVVTRKSPNLREGCSLATAITKFLIVASMLPAILEGHSFQYTLFSFLPNIPIRFRVDALGILFALLSSFLWIVTTVYSIGYMRSLNEHAQTRYYACFALTLSATIGVAFSSNLMTLYFFYEVLTLVTYPLVAHKETEESFAGANKYLFYLVGTSKAFLLVAIIGTYALSGTLDFNQGGLFPSDANPVALILLYLLFLAGIGKAAIIPFHTWLPAAMVAPTPVSALLHAVAVVNTGVFCIFRIILQVFGVARMEALYLGWVTVILASITLVMASLYALSRDNLKTRLAYSTVSQLSYMILGGGLLSASGMAGGVGHIVNHAFSKITLFFCAGSIYAATHKTNISQMGGIGRKMPWTMTAFSVGALSMIGVPLMAGFVTKWQLALGSIESGEKWVLGVLLISTLLNAGYFLPIIYKAFFDVPLQHGEMILQGDPHTEIQGEEGGEPSFLMVFPLLLTAAASLFLGVYPEILSSLIRLVIR